ncbi:MAG: polyribonucleotide nucleotidyltransferase, partial [bacterium]
AKKAYLGQVNHILHDILYEEVRRLITVDKVRPDGRKIDEIRPLFSRVDVLPRPHGSAIFTRGQTQSLSTTTLGSLSEHQIIDGLEEETKYKRFMLHYNFPQYSVGETGRYGAVGRREVGHGALGERAILQVMPSEEEFPYSVRVVSEVIESNGSTSQASICAGVLSLMAAGVPLKATVAGIAMGLVTQGKDYTILTDIQGMEDHLGDMDFKVAGTKDGITALQMDIKIKGLTFDIIEESLAQAKKGRMELLNHMESVLPEPRKEVSKYAPKVKLMQIKPEKIKDVIGAGGKVITKIIEQCNNVKIDIEQDGKVCIMHADYEWVNKAMATIEGIVREAEVGAIYTATVKRVEAFGAFAEIFPGCEGLVHVSKLAKERVANVADVVSVGDQIVVKCIGIDDKGRVDLSRKDALEDSSK